MESNGPTRQYVRGHIALARQLRRTMTPAEAILWKQLRSRRFAGYKFRRQQSIGPYIADFCCHAAKVIVELDGETHVGREEADRRRQADLEAAGYRVLRFWNHDIYEDVATAEDNIWLACSASLPLP